MQRPVIQQNKKNGTDGIPLQDFFLMNPSDLF